MALARKQWYDDQRAKRVEALSFQLWKALIEPDQGQHVNSTGSLLASTHLRSKKVNNSLLWLQGHLLMSLKRMIYQKIDGFGPNGQLRKLFGNWFANMTCIHPWSKDLTGALGPRIKVGSYTLWRRGHVVTVFRWMLLKLCRITRRTESKMFVCHDRCILWSLVIVYF